MPSWSATKSTSMPSPKKKIGDGLRYCMGFAPKSSGKARPPFGLCSLPDVGPLGTTGTYPQMDSLHGATSPASLIDLVLPSSVEGLGLTSAHLEPQSRVFRPLVAREHVRLLHAWRAQLWIALDKLDKLPPPSGGLFSRFRQRNVKVSNDPRLINAMTDLLLEDIEDVEYALRRAHHNFDVELDGMDPSILTPMVDKGFCSACVRVYRRVN